MKKRIAWLLNHAALIERELPIFEELGYEIFVPKIAYFDVSAGVTYKYDEGLTIPQEELQILNKTDFYAYNLEDSIYDILNKYFDIVMFIHNLDLIRNLVDHFNGILAYRAFGRLSIEGSHTDVIMWKLGEGYMRRIEKLGKRFFFLQISENLSEIECEFFQSRTLYAPVGLKKGPAIKDVWTGKNNRILFVCPRIGMVSYFEKTYKDFVKNFGDMPYSVGGSQPIDIEYDKNILGYLPKEQYENLYPSHKVMFYHSTELRHIHYHPLEAIACGLPLVFMGGGQLDLLGGKGLPGRCKDVKDARKKMKRILEGDKRLIENIRKTQPVLLEKYSYEYCKERWGNVLCELEQIDVKRENVVIEKRKRLGVLMPVEYTGGVLDYTIRLIKAIDKGSRINGGLLDIVFGYPKHSNFEQKNYFKELNDINIEMREFYWEQISAERANEISRIMGYHHTFVEKEYCAPNDGIRYFEDCDFLLFTSDRVALPLFSMVPYGCIVHDYIQRYVPEIMGDFFESSFLRLVRKANVNFTTTQSTLADAIQYAGIAKNKIYLLPLFFKTISKTGEIQEDSKKYFLWSTNTARHKNHKMALDALMEYYENGGTLKCYMTGTNTEHFSYDFKEEKSEYEKEISRIINTNKMLRDNLEIMGNLPKNRYHSVLENAAFLLHPGYGDNGNGTAFDAAMLGVPTLSCDYPAMRNMSDKTGIDFKFFDKNDCEKLAELLYWMQEHYLSVSQMLPNPDQLRHHTIEDDKLCENIYNIIKKHSKI